MPPHNAPPAASRSPASLIVFVRLFDLEARHGLGEALFVICALAMFNAGIAIGLPDDIVMMRGSETIKKIIALLAVHFGPWAVPLSLAPRNLRRDFSSNAMFLLLGYPVPATFIFAAKVAWLTVVSLSISVASMMMLWIYRDQQDMLLLNRAFPIARLQLLAFHGPIWMLPLTPMALISVLLGRFLSRTPGLQTWIAGYSFVLWFALWAVVLHVLFAWRLHWPGFHSLPFLGGVLALPVSAPQLAHIYATGYIPGELIAAHLVLAGLLTWAAGKLFIHIDW